MTDVAYLCHNCGSVHEVESVRENLMLDRRTAGSYELPGQPGLLHLRARFLRWRTSRGLARALWPGYLDQRPPARPSASHRAVPAAAAIRLEVARTPPRTREGVTSSVRRPGHATRGAPPPGARVPPSKGASGLARLVLALLVSRGPLRRTTGEGAP